MRKEHLTLILTLFLSATALAQTQYGVPNQLIHLQATTVDPRREPAADPSQAAAGAWYLVQVSRPVTRTDRAGLQRLGLRLTEYVPNLTYVEKLAPDTLRNLSNDQRIRWIGPYRAEYKVSPMIGKTEFKAAFRKTIGGVMLTVTLFPDANPQVVAAAVKEKGGRVVSLTNDTKWGGEKRVTLVAASAAFAAMLAARPDVKWIEETPVRNVRNGTTTGIIQSGGAATPVWSHGLHGEGQILGILDDQLDLNHCFFTDPAVASAGPTHRKVVGLRRTQSAANPSAIGHGTHTSGTLAGDDIGHPGIATNRGIAFNARISWDYLCDITTCCDSTGTICIPPGTLSFLSRLQAESDDGARIHSNSWGSIDTTYNQDEVDIDTFAWNNEDNLVVVASNESGGGVPGVASPESAKNSLAVNAASQSPNQNNLCFGAQGPTTEGRRKPEIFAPGCNINSAQISTACSTTTLSGTSMACPAVAAAGALVRQYFTEGWYPSGTRQPHNAFTPTGALLKATLLNATTDMTGAGLGGYPGNREGWGLLNLSRTLFFAEPAPTPRLLRVWDVRHAAGLAAGESRTFHLPVNGAGQPLKVTLAWTEPPAAVSAATQITNNLTLTVASPGGAQTFLGNNFAGGVSTTGGADDPLNNVEMVLVNSPAAGDWTITVSAPTVSVGQPGQGFAVVASADLTPPPPPTGAQNTLVIRAKLQGIAGEPSLPNLQNVMADVNTYYDTVTYGQTQIVPSFPDTIQLPHDMAYYTNPSRNPLVDMTDDALAALPAGTLTPDIRRIIIVTNDPDFTGDWATTGPWPYDLPAGFTSPISVSIQSADNSVARFTHGLGHQFNLVDLYAHEGVSFSRPAYADEWDNMAKPFNNEHFLAWSKERAHWLTTHGDTIEYVARPAAGATPPPQTFHLFNLETGTANRKAIAIGLSNGAATIDAEHAFYFVESRSKTADAFDAAIPHDGVLIYFVNDLIPQGEGPVILRDKDPATDNIEPFADNDTIDIPGTGIKVEVLPGTGGAAHDIRVTYHPPADTFNLRITKGDISPDDGQFHLWYSPDIWIDSPKNGPDNLASGPPPNDAIENPVVGMTNKVRVRIFNDGPATAQNFDVRVNVSEPYHTIGNQADFNRSLGLIHIDNLAPAGGAVPPGPNNFVSPAILTFDWLPTQTDDAHSCVLVDIINIVGNDTNQFDNEAQENFHKVTSVTGSPFHPVDFHFTMKNPYAATSLFYFRATGVPKDWSVVINPKKALLSPGERIEGVATFTPPPDDKLLCTSQTMEVRSWTPRGDTLIPVGGSVVQVDMRRPTAVDIAVGEDQCQQTDLAGSSTTEKRHCRRIVAHGCTNPPLPNQLIWVKYTSPTGQPVWHQVMTDASGCYEDFLATADSSTWSATAGFDGDKCQGPAQAGPKRSPGGDDGGGPPVGSSKDLWYSLHLGHNFALGQFNKSHQSGPSITFDLERAYRQRFGIYAMLGYHYFDAKQAGTDDEWISNLSLNLRAYAPAGPWLRFVGIGPGIYRDRSGSSSVGANVSFGLDFPLQPKFMGEAGADLHVARPAGDLRLFLDLKLGFKWQF